MAVVCTVLCVCATLGYKTLTVVWGRSAQRGPGGQGAKPPEAENISAFIRLREAANLSYSLYNYKLSKLHACVVSHKN